MCSIILVWLLINNKLTQWVVILHEFNLEFHTPKNEKVITLVSFIIDLPNGIIGPTLNNPLHNDHMFTITAYNT